MTFAVIKDSQTVGIRRRRLKMGKGPTYFSAMQITRYTFSLLFLLAAGSLFSQQSNNWCGYTGFSPWLDEYQRHRGDHPEGVDTNWLYVPVTVHIVGEDDGDGYFRMDQAVEAVCEMSQKYAPLHVRFYLMPGDPVRYINNTAWYKHDWDNGAEMINAKKIPGRLNAFVVSDPAGNCGYSWKDAIVLGKGCSGTGNSTWAHEAGHHFSLPHPFSGWEGFNWDYQEPAPSEIDGHNVEKTDGTNCYSSGDGFCDTDPDYLNYRWQCDNDGRSTVLEHDPNGQEFRSDATLYMGYAYDACANRFSPEQQEAIRANLQSQHSSYLQISTPPLPEIDDADQVNLVSPIDTALVQYNNVVLKWDPVPNATLYSVEVSLFGSHTPDLFYQTVYNNTTVTITKGLLKSHLFYWRVKAYNEWDLCQPYDQAQTGVFRTQDLTATNEFERNVSGDLMPNPAVPGLPATLVVNSGQTMSARLSVTDATGKVCQQQLVRLSPDENRIDIPTDGLSAGIYVVMLQNDKGSMVRKLVVAD